MLYPTGPVVQAWFAYRLLKFSRMPYIPIFCWGLSLLRCLSTFVLGVEAGIANSLLEFEPKFKWLVVLVLAVGASEDVIIAFCLVYNFIQQRSNSSNVRTIGALNQLILWTIGMWTLLAGVPLSSVLILRPETGLLTSVAAVTMLICVSWPPIFSLESRLLRISFQFLKMEENCKGLILWYRKRILIQYAQSFGLEFSHSFRNVSCFNFFS